MIFEVELGLCFVIFLKRVTGIIEDKIIYLKRCDNDKVFQIKTRREIIIIELPSKYFDFSFLVEYFPKYLQGSK